MHARRRVAQQDGVPDDADGAKDDAKQPALLRAVRHRRRGHVRARAHKVARDREKLHLRRRPPAQAPDDGGQKCRVAYSPAAPVKHRVDAKLSHAKRPHPPIRKRRPHILEPKLPPRLCIPILPLLPRLHHPFLRAAQKPRRRRLIRQPHPRRHAQHHARHALDNQNPPPSAHAPDAVQVPDAVRQQPAHGAGHGRADKQVAHAPRQLVLGVKERQVDGEAREEARFDDAEDETAREQAGVGGDEARERRDEAPGNGEEREPATRRKELEDEVGGDFKEQIGDEKDGHGDLKLRRGQVQVLFEPVEARVSNVDSGGKGRQKGG
ncbi:hypothetical protein BBAD15_g4140 [Beauveria bassiana D1-5]|uniref:Uncharacterized protein n=1 Tax=Beauveria bassiana D1-5 TaxID=1245745 RepID=A0A0A2VRH5_BEABA|nr:hypothetical protein BBAD15_g4140 [Beauveria bassiana D1-5]